MKILNLYAGIGGNRKNWDSLGDFEITAVENVPEIAKIYADFFPADKMIIGDAHQYLLDHYKEFDFIWSSPPCPSHSKARFGLGVGSCKVKGVYPDMRLYQEIIFLEKHFKGKYCVENVMAYYKPLIIPQVVGRHWYWTNFYIPNVKVAPSRICQESKKYNKSPVKRFDTNDFEKLLGFDLSKYTGVDKRLLLRNCVEPEIGLHILKEALKETPKLF